MKCPNCEKDGLTERKRPLTVLENGGGFIGDPPTVVEEVEADGSVHRCHQLAITITLPGVSPFGLTIRTSIEDLLSPQAMDLIWEPSIEQLRQQLEFRSEKAS